jgi:hypothetical protein
MKTTAAALLAATAALTLAGAAQASEERHFGYDADNDAAKHRTQNIELWIRQGLMGGITVTHFFRSRGDGFDVRPVYPPWSDKALSEALDGPPSGLSFYAVDPKQGEGFARGACHGAAKAWLVMAPPKPNQPMRIAVLADDNKKPVVCELLDYRWRGEWLLPKRRNETGRAFDQGAQKTF